ncbi:hypothetical protein Ancab_010185 [Ancistrocladus abbreviatus]
MASVVSTVSNGFFACGKASIPSLRQSRQESFFGSQFASCPSSYSHSTSRKKMMGVVRAEAVNPEIRKSEEKVVDTVVVTELSKPVTAYCRCWRSGTFPLCDGSHLKHNKATGDNVGPLILKK